MAAVGGLVLVALGSQAGARLPAYVMRSTPEAGPVDPAVQRRYSGVFARCQEAATTTDGTARCFVQEFDRQDAALNHAWRAVLARLARADRTELVRAQRRWIAARDPFCNHAADGYRGGTIRPVIYHACRAEQTIRRTMWLERLPGGPAKTLPPRAQTG